MYASRNNTINFGYLWRYLYKGGVPMSRVLILLNGALLAATIYGIAASWSAIELIPLVLFGSSLLLLNMHDSRAAQLSLLLANGTFAALGIFLVLIATVGGLFNYGLGAIASLLLLAPVAVLYANAVHGRKMLALTS